MRALHDAIRDRTRGPQWQRPCGPLQCKGITVRVERYVEAAEWLAEQQVGVCPLIETNELLPSGFLAGRESGILTQNLVAIDACHNAFDPHGVFLSARAPQEELEAAFGRCRYLASDADELKAIDELAGPRLQRGYLENVALRVLAEYSPREAGGFCTKDSEELARLLRKARNLAVRGVFVPLDPIGDLCSQVREAFSLVKKLRSDLPCMLHSFCLEGVLEPLAAGDAELLNTVRMIAALNDTSLYARFFIA